MVMGKLAAGLGKALYKGATTKPGMIGIVGGAAALGMASQVAPAARDAAMDVAFGDPNADTTFLGRKLTPGAVVDSMVPGGRSGTGALAIGGATTVGGAAVGGLIGSFRGAKAGFKGGLIGAAAGAALGRSSCSWAWWCVYQ
jgi:hypothetical protein